MSIEKFNILIRIAPNDWIWPHMAYNVDTFGGCVDGMAAITAIIVANKMLQSVR